MAYDHPDEKIRQICWEFYQDSVHAQHLNVETKEEYENRLGNPRSYGTYKAGEPIGLSN